MKWHVKCIYVKFALLAVKTKFKTSLSDHFLSWKIIHTYTIHPSPITTYPVPSVLCQGLRESIAANCSRVQGSERTYVVTKNMSLHTEMPSVWESNRQPPCGEATVLITAPLCLPKVICSVFTLTFWNYSCNHFKYLMPLVLEGVAQLAVGIKANICMFLLTFYLRK